MGAKTLTSHLLSLVKLVVGTRGSGKTLLMTHFVVECLQKAWALKQLLLLRPDLEWFYKRYKKNVWANYPVKALWIPYQGHKPVLLESKKLDIEKLIIWDPEYRDGTIFFDEIDQVADRQDWQSTVGKMLTAGIQVMRHNNLSFVASIQSLNWLNARLQWQADIIIKCRDLAFTPWGKENNVPPGSVTATTWIDKSGVMTGYAYEENMKVYAMKFFGKRYWDCYSTIHDFDILAGKTRFKLLLPQKEIDLTGKDERDNDDMALVNQVLASLINEGNVDKVYSSDIKKRLGDMGATTDMSRVGKYLHELGIESKQVAGKTIYNLEALVE